MKKLLTLAIVVISMTLTTNAQSDSIRIVLSADSMISKADESLRLIQLGYQEQKANPKVNMDRQTQLKSTQALIAALEMTKMLLKENKRLKLNYLKEEQHTKIAFNRVLQLEAELKECQENK